MMKEEKNIAAKEKIKELKESKNINTLLYTSFNIKKEYIIFVREKKK